MYQLRIVDRNRTVLATRVFRYQVDIIRFTNRKITYNDFKKRITPKKYKTYKDYFEIKKI